MAWFNTGGGGALSETVLWTNSSPSDNFSAQTVNLSDSVVNYKYLKFIYRGRNASAVTSSIIYSVDDYLTFAPANDTFQGAMHYRRMPSSTSYWYVRDIRSSSDRSKVVFGDCFSFPVNGGSTSGAAAYNVPTEIIGLK